MAKEPVSIHTNEEFLELIKYLQDHIRCKADHPTELTIIVFKDAIQVNKIK